MPSRDSVCSNGTYQRVGSRCSDYIDYGSSVGHAKINAKAKEKDYGDARDGRFCKFGLFHLGHACIDYLVCNDSVNLAFFANPWEGHLQFCEGSAQDVSGKLQEADLVATCSLV